MRTVLARGMRTRPGTELSPHFSGRHWQKLASLRERTLKKKHSTQRLQRLSDGESEQLPCPPGGRGFLSGALLLLFGVLLIRPGIGMMRRALRLPDVAGAGASGFRSLRLVARIPVNATKIVWRLRSQNSLYSPATISTKLFLLIHATVRMVAIRAKTRKSFAPVLKTGITLSPSKFFRVT